MARHRDGLRSPLSDSGTPAAKAHDFIAWMEDYQDESRRPIVLKKP